MSEIKKFKALGGMAERSRVGGAEYVSLADYDAALGREAALRGEISCLKAVLNGMEFKQVDDMVSDGVDACLFLGQETARTIKGIQAGRDELREHLETEKRANYNAKVALKAASETCELWKGRTTNLTHANAGLQQRLTVAEQLLREVRDSGEWNSSALEFIRCEGFEVLAKIEAALKPAEEGEGS